MGGGEREQYGSPYGGAAIGPVPQFQMELARSPLRDRRSSEELSLEEDLEMRMRARVINDLLKGLLKTDSLLDLPDFDPKNAPQHYLYPMS